jgi:hypothetical protein
MLARRFLPVLSLTVVFLMPYPTLVEEVREMQAPESEGPQVKRPRHPREIQSRGRHPGEISGTDTLRVCSVLSAVFGTTFWRPYRLS